MIAINFDKAYQQLLHEVYHKPDYEVECRLGGMRESLNKQFTILDPSQFLQTSKSRNFRHIFADKFFHWMLSGSTDMTELIGDNPNAKNFMAGGELPDNFSTAYGPRINDQLPRLIELLAEKPNTRRAVMHILLPTDKIILDVDTKLEYPCTNSIQLFIRDGELNMTVLMRSNNIVTTICYDVYNFCNLQLHILQKLQAKGLQLRLGTYTQFMASAHILNKELELAGKILSDYENN